MQECRLLSLKIDVRSGIDQWKNIVHITYTMWKEVFGKMKKMPDDTNIFWETRASHISAIKNLNSSCFSLDELDDSSPDLCLVIDAFASVPGAKFSNAAAVTYIENDEIISCMITSSLITLNFYPEILPLQSKKFNIQLYNNFKHLKLKTPKLPHRTNYLEFLDKYFRDVLALNAA